MYYEYISFLGLFSPRDSNCLGLDICTFEFLFTLFSIYLPLIYVLTGLIAQQISLYIQNSSVIHWLYVYFYPLEDIASEILHLPPPLLPSCSLYSCHPMISLPHRPRNSFLSLLCEPSCLLSPTYFSPLVYSLI